MKKRICKLKESKAVKALLALSLALALLLSVAGPVLVKADEIIPSYSDLINDAYAWMHVVFPSTNAHGNDTKYANKHLLFVWDKQGEYGSEIYIDTLQWVNTSVGNDGFCEYEVDLYDKASASAEDYNVKNTTRKVYMLRNTDGTGAWQQDSFAHQYSSYLGVRFCYYTDRQTPIIEGASNSIAIRERVFNINYAANLEYGVENIKQVNVLQEPVTLKGNATEGQWNAFIESTKDFIGYHYLTENGATLWKEMRFNHDVYPYWEQDADGTRKLMIYAPYEQTIYMEKDYGFYTEHGVFDYYISTIELTDEWCIQPYAWYTDYQPDTSVPEKVFEVIVLPYIKDGWGVDANAERTLIEVYDSKEDAISAYNADEGIVEVTPTIPPQPSPEPLPPTDDSESMGFVDFIKQFENLFNASGNLWKIMYYCFAFLPQQILWCLWSVVQIFLAVMVIKWIRE